MSHGPANKNGNMYALIVAEASNLLWLPSFVPDFLHHQVKRCARKSAVFLRELSPEGQKRLDARNIKDGIEGYLGTGTGFEASCKELSVASKDKVGAYPRAK